MRNALGRWCLRTLVTLAVLLALLTTAGRAFMLWLNEARAEALVARFAPELPLRLENADFGWQGLNPRIEVEELLLGDSRISDLKIQFDWLESLARGGMVFSHLGNGAAQLRFEPRAAGGYRLAGMPETAEGGIAFRTTLEHTDHMDLNAALYLSTPGSAAAPLTLSLRATNQAARRRWALRLADSGCEPIERCTLSFDAEEYLAVPLWQSASLALRSELGADGLALPAVLPGGGSLRLDRAAVRWDATQRDWRQASTPLRSGAEAAAGSQEQSADRSGAPVAGRLDVDLALSDIRLPGGRPFALSLTASGSSHPGFAVARSFDASLSVGEETVALPELWLRWVPDRLQLYTAEVNLERALEQIAETRLDDDVVGTWLEELAIAGRLEDLRVVGDLRAGNWSWAAGLQGGAMSGYQGAPTASGLNGRIVGYERGMAAGIESASSKVGFPDVFRDLWPVARLSARLELHWRQGYLSLIGEDILADLQQQGSSETPIAVGRFRLAVPGDPLEQTLALTVRVPSLTMATAQRFVPTQINKDLKQWLREAPQAGKLKDLTFAFHGYVRGRQGPTARRNALTARIEDGALRFDPNWPLLEDLAGQFDLSGQAAGFRADRARTLEVQLDGSRAAFEPGERRLALKLAARGSGDAMLDFLRTSPLKEPLAFIAPEWSGAGSVSAAGDVSVPLGPGAAASTAAASPDNAAAVSATDGVVADLRLELDALDLELPAERLSFANLSGPVRFQTPAHLTSPGLRGTLHGERIDSTIDSDDGQIRFSFQGDAEPLLVYRTLDLSDPGFAAGSTRYDGTLAFSLGGEPAELKIGTDLRGIALDLPGELAKAADDRRDTRIVASFEADRTKLTVAQRVLDAALTVREGSVRSGQLSLRGTAPGLPQSKLLAADAHNRALPDEPRLVISGAIADLPLAAGSGDEGLFGPVPVRIDSLRVGALMADDTDLGPVAISGTLDGPAFALAVFGEQIEGRFTKLSDELLDVALSQVRLPEVEGDGAPLAELDVRLVTEPDRLHDRVSVSTRPSVAADPLPPSLIEALPAARVAVDALTLGQEPFGRWRFELEPAPNRLVIRNLDAQVKGLSITAPTVTWTATPNETRFAGQLNADDLAKVLPQWDYEPFLETKSATIDAEFRWPGSPANFNLLTASGEALFEASDGHFADIDSGRNALRIFSLLNFSALTRRMNLDFSDVTGRGVTFESLSAPVRLEEGDLSFREPMAMEGTGSKFRLSGTVDLDTGALDNDMVVTLPLNKGLPWYAAYVALANPLAGLGVLVGERMLRKPLEQFSSARYHISGTLDDPDARLVSIFDNDMSTELPAPVPEPEPSAPVQQ